MAQLDIPGIKTALKTILDAANTTTGSPIDLSQNMSIRVAKVLKVNPAITPIQPTFYPYVSVFASDKDIENKTIGHGGSHANAIRRGDLTLNIVGCVMNPKISNVLEDAAHEDVERLMENIEEILRSNIDIGSTVSWSVPDRVTYHSLVNDEGTVVRGGIMTLVCTKNY